MAMRTASVACLCKCIVSSHLPKRCLARMLPLSPPRCLANSLAQAFAKYSLSHVIKAQLSCEDLRCRYYAGAHTSKPMQPVHSHRGGHTCYSTGYQRKRKALSPWPPRPPRPRKEQSRSHTVTPAAAPCLPLAPSPHPAHSRPMCPQACTC